MPIAPLFRRFCLLFGGRRLDAVRQNRSLKDASEERHPRDPRKRASDKYV